MDSAAFASTQNVVAQLIPWTVFDPGRIMRTLSSETAPANFRKRFAKTVSVVATVVLLTAVCVLPIGWRYVEDIPAINPNHIAAGLILFLALVAACGALGELVLLPVAGRRAPFLFQYCMAFMMAALALVISIARPPGRPRSKLNECINNLRQIDGAKQQWALETKQSSNTIPVAADLAPYLGRGPQSTFPTCPAKGVYTLQAISLPPVCSAKGHVLESF